MSHSTRRSRRLLVCVASFVLTPALGWADELDQFTKLPAAAKTILDAAEDVVLYSIDPGEPGKPRDPEQRGGFHGYEILGKTTLGKAAIRRRVRSAIETGIAESDGVSGCFRPRHGLRARHDGKTLDLLICFECLSIKVVVGDEQSFVWTSQSPQKTLDRVLREAGATLAAKSDAD